MLIDFFAWDNCVKKVRNIYRNRHAVAGRRLLVRMFSGFSEINVVYFKKLYAVLGNILDLFGLTRIFCNGYFYGFQSL